MFPKLDVYMDGATEPRTIHTTSLDFWTYEDLVAKKPNGRTSEHGMRLTIAFIHVEGREPKNLEEVKLWAREHAVNVAVGRDADPTQTDHTDD